jgi:hypothetical protein
LKSAAPSLDLGCVSCSTQSMKVKQKPWKPGELVRNIGEPILLSSVQLSGVTASAARSGEEVQIWTRLMMTSDDKHFHRIAEGLVAAIEFCLSQDGKAAALRRASTILLVIRPDETAELWVDTAASSIQAMMKREMQAGSVVFENDIGDVTGMDFPLVKIGQKDKVLCLFREGWRFGLFFDFNANREFDRERMSRSIGTMCRVMRYRHLYDVFSDEQILTRVIESGWFPFVEILSEFNVIADMCAAGFELDATEAELLERFDSLRLERMFSRWLARPHFKQKEALLRSALNTYQADEYIATIKISLTEIEGLLSAAYREVHGKGARIKKLLEFAIASAEERAGSPNTLLFPSGFGQYLKRYTFADFDPKGVPGIAGSRHAVGHGAASSETYTKIRALQALLTLDQLAFYT